MTPETAARIAAMIEGENLPEVTQVVNGVPVALGAQPRRRSADAVTARQTGQRSKLSLAKWRAWFARPRRLSQGIRPRYFSAARQSCGPLLLR
jgi:hypothetical protein